MCHMSNSEKNMLRNSVSFKNFGVFISNKNFCNLGYVKNSKNQLLDTQADQIPYWCDEKFIFKLATMQCSWCLFWQKEFNLKFAENFMG